MAHVESGIKYLSLARKGSSTTYDCFTKCLEWELKTDISNRFKFYSCSFEEDGNDKDVSSITFETSEVDCNAFSHEVPKLITKTSTNRSSASSVRCTCNPAINTICQTALMVLFFIYLKFFLLIKSALNSLIEILIEYN